MKRLVLLLLTVLVALAAGSCALENTGNKKVYEDITLDIKDRAVQINDARGNVRRVRLLDVYHFIFSNTHRTAGSS